MEFLALGGLLLYGVSQGQERTDLQPVIPDSKKESSNKLLKISNIQEIEHNRLKENNYPVVENVLESIPNTSRIVEEKEKPIISTSFESMFEPLSIRNGGVVKSMNEAPMNGSIEDPRLKREIDYMEGFSDFNGTNMDYGVTTDFTHNNMIPSTSMRDQPLMNYENFNRRLDLQTGSSRDWVPKKEVEKMFAPAKHGTKGKSRLILNGELDSRYITSHKNNMGNLPFQNKVKVKPGIDGQIQEGRHNTYRVLPRNIDELRSETNQRLTYEQPMIESGKQGRLPAKIGQHQTLKNLYDSRDVQEGKASFSKAVPRPQLTYTSNEKRSQSRSYQGPAINTNTGNIVVGEYEESGRQNYRGDGIGHNVNSTTRGHNVSKDSIQQYANNRDSTSHTITGHAYISQVGYTNLQDNAKKTIKQTTLYSHNGNVNPQDHQSYSTLQDNAKQTIKQTTLYSHNGNVNPNDHQSYSTLQDNAKQTIKQTTLYSHNGNVNPQDHQSYSTLQDNAKQTIKQTTLYSHNGNVNPNDHQSYSSLTDEARPTIKHSTLYTQEGNMVPNVYQTYSNLQDNAKTTIKQTTLTQKEFNMRGYDKSYARDKNFKAKPTIKHSTLFTTPEQNLTRTGGATDRQIIMDKARTTIKQTTLLEGHVSALGSVEKKARTFDDALNMQIDDCKEESLRTRPHQGGNQKYRTYYEKESDTRQKMFTNSAREPSITRPLDYQTPDMNLSYSTRGRDSGKEDNYHITGDFINTLKDNPFVNDLMHQKNTNYTL